MIVKIQIIAAVLAFGLAGCDSNVQTAERSETIKSAGTIREIDAENRRFIVRADGHILTLRATDQVQNFDQLEVGDRIRVEYTETVAVGMALPGDSGTPEAASISLKAPVGAKPGVAELEMVSVVLQFLAYDTRDNMATLRSQNGDILRVHVAREMRSFAKSRQPGDRILIGFERAAAITVEPAG